MGSSPKLCIERTAQSMEATFFPFDRPRGCLFLVLTRTRAVQDIQTLATKPSLAAAVLKN